MAGKLKTIWLLIVFMTRSMVNLRTLSFLLLMLLLSAYLLWGLPALETDSEALFQPVSFSVVDQDKTLLSRKIIDQIASMDLVDQVYVETLPDAKSRLDRNESLLILVIPEDFYAISLRAEERPPLVVHLNERKPIESSLFVRLLDNMSASIEGVQASYFAMAAHLRPLYDDPEAFGPVLDRAASRVALLVLGRRATLEIDEQMKLNTISFVISSLLCLFILLTSLLLITQIQQERTSGVRDRMVLANVSWWQAVIARQISSLLWLAMVLLPLLIGLFRIYQEADRLSFVLTALLLHWVAALAAQAAANFARPDHMLLLGAWLLILALLLVSGCIYPEELLPDPVVRVGQLTPVYWSFQTFYRILQGQPLQQPASYAAAGFVLAASVLAGVSWHQKQRPVDTGGAICDI